jgi:hypothetical protein
VDYQNSGLAASGHNIIYGHGWASANRNVVVFEDSRADFVIGGYNNHVDGIGDPFQPSDYGEAIGNKVFIKDSLVSRYVTGGLNNLGLGLGFATGNQIFLEGAVEIGLGLYGGQTFADPAGAGWDAFTANALTVRLPNGIMVGDRVDQGTIKRFESFRFELDPGMPSDAPALEAFMRIHLSDALTGKVSAIESVDMAVDALPGLGQGFLLLKAPDIVDDGLFEQAGVQGAKGLGLILDFDLELMKDPAEPDTLTAVYKGASDHPRMGALAGGRAMGLALLAQGQDLLSGQGLSAAMGRPFLSPCPSVFLAAGASKIKLGRGGGSKLASFQGLMGLGCAAIWRRAS